MTQTNKWPGEVAASAEPDQIHPYAKDAEMNEATDSTRLAIEKATAALGVLELEGASGEDIMAIGDRFGLTVDQLIEAVAADLCNRFAAVEADHQRNEVERDELMASSKNWGKKQADIEILFTPLPWTRTELVTMTESVVALFLGQMVSDTDHSASMTDLTANAAAAARQGFIERVMELSATSFPEVRA
ncbi:MAG: hypothetical protein PGN22_05155 [Agrobacterium cavarae]